jgi:hypothetical protein
VTSRVKARRRERLEQLVDVLTQDVRIRELDVRHAQMQARAVQAVLENSEWLTAEQIGELGAFSKSNLAAPANRWKQEGKIFALPYQGQDRFPRYALDQDRQFQATGDLARTPGWLQASAIPIRAGRQRAFRPDSKQ